jgi:hypothetical protein
MERRCGILPQIAIRSGISRSFVVAHTTRQLADKSHQAHEVERQSVIVNESAAIGRVLSRALQAQHTPHNTNTTTLRIKQ